MALCGDIIKFAVCLNVIFYMKRIVFVNCIVAAFLICGCQKGEVVPPSPSPSPSPYDRRGEVDAVSQKINVETYTIGEDCAPGSYAGCVYNRLTNRTNIFSNKTTRAVVVSKNSGLTLYECMDIFACFDNGGVVILMNPDAASYNEFLGDMAHAASFPLLDEYHTSGIEQDEWEESCREKLFNCATLDYELAGNPYECLAFCGKDKFLCPKIHQTAGEAQTGKAADALARWISWTLDRNTPKPEDEIPDISSDYFCQSATISCVSSKILGGALTAPYTDVAEIRVKWSMAYAPSPNYDYYYVDEGITFHTANLEPVPDPADNRKWHFIDPQYEICYLDGFEDRLELSLRDNDGHLISSSYNALGYHPGIINEDFKSGVTSGVVSTSNPAVPGYFGTVRPCLAGEVTSFRQAVSEGVRNANRFVCSIGQECDISGIMANCEARYNYANFRYVGKQPQVNFFKDAAAGSQYSYDIAPLLLSDCEQHNSFFTRPAANPSGMPVLHLVGGWKIRRISQIAVPPYWQSYGSDVYIGEHEDYIDLGKPYRYVENWTLDCIEYGDLTADSNPSIQDFEQAYVRDLCPEDGNRTVSVGGCDSSDSYEANLVFNRFMVDFEQMSDSYARQGFTGLFTFSFVSENGRRIVKSFEIKK